MFSLSVINELLIIKSEESTHLPKMAQRPIPLKYMVPLSFIDIILWVDQSFVPKYTVS